MSFASKPYIVILFAWKHCYLNTVTSVFCCGTLLGSKAERLHKSKQYRCHDYVLPFWLLPVVSVKGDKLLSFTDAQPYLPKCLAWQQATVSFVADGTNVPFACIS